MLECGKRAVTIGSSTYAMSSLQQTDRTCSPGGGQAILQRRASAQGTAGILGPDGPGSRRDVRRRLAGHRGNQEEDRLIRPWFGIVHGGCNGDACAFPPV